MRQIDPRVNLLHRDFLAHFLTLSLSRSLYLYRSLAPFSFTPSFPLLRPFSLESFGIGTSALGLLCPMVPRGLEPRTLRLLAVRSNQLSYETAARGELFVGNSRREFFP